MDSTCRFGEIAYLNSLPLRLPVAIQHEWNLDIHQAEPSRLNQAILEGHLDVSPVSSAFYLRHQDQLTLLPDIAIASAGPVMSVLMIAPEDRDAWLQANAVAVPAASETSVALGQYLWQHWTGRHPDDIEWLVYPTGHAQHYVSHQIPVLTIGDEALRLCKQLPENLQCIDLATAWHALTGLPFVFAVWVGRTEWVETHPVLWQALPQLLQSQKQATLHSSEQWNQLIETAHQMEPHLSYEELTAYYLDALDYNWGQPHQEALIQFGEIIVWLDSHDRAGHRSLLSRPVLHR